MDHELVSGGAAGERMSVKESCNIARKTRSAFTLVELMVVIIIIVMLMSIVYSVIINTRGRHKFAQVKTDITGLEMALKSYRNTYGTWPGQSGVSVDRCYIENNGVIVKILTGDPNDPDSVAFNPRRIRFFEDIRNSWTNQGGSDLYVDPWGKPYMIAFDNDNDSSINTTNDPSLFFYGGEQQRRIYFNVKSKVGVVAMKDTNYFTPVETVPGSGVYRPSYTITIADDSDAWCSWKLLKTASY